MMMFSFVAANAQIVYTDVNPDDTITCNAPPLCTAIDSLDLDNDGNIDFNLSTYYHFIGLCGIPPPRGISNAMVSTISVNSFYGIDSSNPSALNYGDTIDGNLIWSNGADTLRSLYRTTCLPIISSDAGNWSSGTDNYLPVKISILGNNYFGWIRMYFPETYTYFKIILKDYAYNSIPNQAILAGQTFATGISENSFPSSITLFPNPVSNHFTIALGSINKNVEVTITDIAGKIIYTTTSRETQKIEVNTKDFAEGVYIVQFHSADFIETKKLIVEK